VPKAAGSSEPANTPALPDAVPVPIHEQPTVPMPQAPPLPDAVPVPIHEQPTVPIPEPEPGDAVPVPIHEQPTHVDGIPVHIDAEPPGGSDVPPESVPGGDDGVPVPIDDTELPEREAPTDDPEKTGRWQRPEEPGPDGPQPADGRPGPERPPGGVEPEVIAMLSDGSLVYGAPDQPFTRADAEREYDRLIGDTPHREAQIIEDLDTGECIVVQGSTIDTKIDPAVRESFLADRPDVARWRTARHYHPIGRGRVTPPAQRYPSTYDMRGAEQDARRNFVPQTETLDFATEQGRGSVPFGYDQTKKQPFWIGVPDASGVVRPKRFTNIVEYQLWYDDRVAER
jgi:hypothetical protein